MARELQLTVILALAGIPRDALEPAAFVPPAQPTPGNDTGRSEVSQAATGD